MNLRHAAKQLVRPTASRRRAGRLLVTGRGPRRGASLIELAVVLPVLMLIALGSVDFGRFAYHYIAVTHSVRAGAEYGIMNPYTPSQQATWAAAIQQTARDELTGQTSCDPTSLTTTTTVVIESDGLRRVHVVAAYTGFETLVDWPGIPHQPTLRSTVVMRVIR